jgi:transposase-like protein
VGAHYLIRTRKQWRCRGCHASFSPTSGTAFHKRKIPCLKLLQALKLFVAGSNGVSASQAAAFLDVDHRTAWLLFSKIREAFVLTAEAAPMTGIVQADGGHFCGKPRRANKRSKADSVAVNAKLRGRKAAIDPTVRPSDLEPWNVIKLRNRRIALVIRQLGHPGSGAIRTHVVVVHSENAASVVPAVKAIVQSGGTVMTDSGSGYGALRVEFNHLTVNHSKEYSTPKGVNNNQAESFISRLRRAEFGVFRGMRAQYFLDYCWEMAWREDVRKKSVLERVIDAFQRVRRCPPSTSFKGYYQGARRRVEWLAPPSFPEGASPVPS